MTVILLLVYFTFKSPTVNDPRKEITKCAKNMYREFKELGAVFNSQCLGLCHSDITNEDYAVDIVHVPRTEEDNKPENQCEAYRNGLIGKFIELDKDGNVVRVVG